jgi:dsRNA-specific ribonuclease
MLLRAMTHRSYALNWLHPREAKVEGWWRSPNAVKTVATYEQVVNVVSNATLAPLGLSLLYFLTQSYLFQKYPTASSSHINREGRALCAAPLLASLGSAHFLLAQNKLVLADLRGLSEEGQEILLRDTTCALVAAIYADQGIAAVSAFAGEHVFPPLMKLRETVDLVQPGNALECLNSVLKAAHLLPHYRTKQVLHEGTENAEYVVGLLIGGMEMATGQGTTTQAAKSSAARAALRNSALVALLPASAKAKVLSPRVLPLF